MFQLVLCDTVGRNTWPAKRQQFCPFEGSKFHYVYKMYMILVPSAFIFLNIHNTSCVSTQLVDSVTAGRTGTAACAGIHFSGRTCKGSCFPCFSFLSFFWGELQVHFRKTAEKLAL